MLPVRLVPAGPDREEPSVSVLEAGGTHRLWVLLSLYF